MANFPIHLKDVTADWVAACLGVHASEFRAFNLTIPEIRRGYGSEIGFITIESDGPLIPHKMIVKVPPEYPGARTMVRELGAFAAESGFYREVAPLTQIRTPEIYRAEYEEQSGDGVMLMQDCSQMRTFTFDAPTDLSCLRDIVKSLARMNAGWYERTAELSTFDAVMTPDSPRWKQSAERVQASWQPWLTSELAAFAPTGAMEVCERLSRQAESLFLDHWPTRHLTLTHMDFHQQNLFYDEGADDPIVVIDWDGCHIGCGPHDLAYLLGMYDVEQRRSLEPALLAQYHDDMVAFGVRDYSAADIYADYRFGTLFNTYLLPLLISLDMTTDADRALAEDLTHRLLTSVLDHEAQLLLSA